MMLYFIKNKKDCTGCSACFSACPKKCISMKADEEGFLYPVADLNTCFHCGLCEKICPINSGWSGYRYSDFACAFKSNMYQTWHQSSSGGAFTELCKAWNPDAFILGAKWSELYVEHTCVKGIENIGVLRKSKYIASDLGNSFTLVKKLLQQNQAVVFSGVPCQVAGLRNYLKNDYDNLLTIDLICHGVGSPFVFNSSIECMSRDLKATIVKYEFRSKRKIYEKEHITRVWFEDGKSRYITNDRYMQLFLSQMCLRPSCSGNCRFRSENRPGDITIADFKGLAEVFPKLTGGKYNYSAVIPNTEKGMDAVKKLDHMSICECSLDDIKKHNPLFYKQTWIQQDRDEFFESFVTEPFNTITIWTKPATIDKTDLKDRIYQLLPVLVRRKLRKR